ncbi:hypothetical protein PHAVU_008G247100 [Phaseolus vulgaris]|uniref:Uncharacterized protein n=1 Tax=Phaseolus vulgaris TaxID=3885 RepID=V7B816_PHAVU|nr:hypothetical protein PHAVU_008G247100g [Phaseolus vulgaris]ESW14032.1 hypothetical protein PHAVU_008G247100g [Phaseolus vulgaris]
MNLWSDNETYDDKFKEVGLLRSIEASLSHYALQLRVRCRHKMRYRHRMRSVAALSCCKDLPDERPKMVEVAKELEYIDFMLLKPDSKGTEYVTSDSSSTLLNSQPSSSTIKILHLFQEIGSVPTIKPR